MRNINQNNQIKIGAVISYVAIAFNILAGLVYTPWMISKIGQSQYGLYTLATSLINMLMIDFGMSAAATRFVAKYRAESNQDAVNNILGIIYKLYIVIDIILCFILIFAFFFIGKIYKNLSFEEVEHFKTIYIMIASFSIISFPCITLNGILQAYEKFVQIKTCDLLCKFFTIFVMIFVLIFDGTLNNVVLVHILCGLATIALKFFIIKVTTPVKVNFKCKSKKMLKELFSFSIWATIAGVAQRLIFNIMPSILGVFANSINIAVFGIGSAIEGYIFTFAFALNGLFLPKISRLIVDKDNSIEILMVKIGRIQLIIVGLIYIGFVSIGKHFILQWMGQDFINSYYCGVILIFPSLISLTQEIANTTIIAMNKVREQAKIMIVWSVINVILSLILSPSLGAIGASISICVSYLGKTVFLNILYHKKLNINIFNFFRQCHLKMLWQLGLCLIFSLTINYYLPDTGWIWLVAKGGLIIVFYLAVMWFFAMNQYEKSLFLIPINKVFNKFKRSN